MAEALVLLVIKKLGFILAGESVKVLSSQLGIELSLLAGTESKIKQIKRELEVMKSFLIEAELQEGHNASLRAWLKQVKEIAYEIVDIIDEYQYFIGAHRSGFKGFLKNVIHKSNNIASWHHIATQLEQIEISLQNISNMKSRYSIKMMGESSSSNFMSGQHQPLAISPYLMDQDELVGINEEKGKLLQWLTDGEHSRSVISVWGMGGSGKTTLVRNVYDSEVIKKNFKCCAWITVSQKYQVEDILRKTIKEVCGTKEMIPVDIENMDQIKLVQLLKESMQEKSYLIILDDIWGRDAWIDIQVALLENNCGSRVVITTRSQEIASSLASKGRDLELKGLQEKEAWDLFCRTTFQNEGDKSCPQLLQGLGKKIVEKCQGLPLAIVAMGSVLSFRPKEESVWIKFYDQLNWELTGNSDNVELNWASSILNLSYNYLPSHLKNCFLYCSIFPEDYLIHRKRLIRLWVAEGFVERRGMQTVEEVAEEYLNELIQRCMLQVVARNHFGRVKACRMHDLVRELSITTSRNEKFCIVCNKSEDWERLMGEKARRLSVQAFNDRIETSIDFSGIRSFIVFDTISYRSSLLSMVLSSSKYMTVLDLQDAPVESVPDEVTHLFNLRHLGLRNTKVKKLPKSLGRLRNLQQLDLSNSKIEKLPNSITKLKKLRHLFAERIPDPTYAIYHYHSLVGVQVPNGFWDLKELQTILSVEANSSLMERLGNLTQLRSFRIMNVKGNQCAQLFASVSKMPFLSHFEVCASDENEVLLLDAFSPPPQHLRLLNLQGRLAEGDVDSRLLHALGKNLNRLDLCWSGLRNDPLPSLSHFLNLTKLFLWRTYDGQQLCFRAGWFPKLKDLTLGDMQQLNRIEIEEGSLEILNDLCLWDLAGLKEVPQGVRFLSSLKSIVSIGMPKEFVEGLKGRDWSNLQHIPKISYWPSPKSHTGLDSSC